MTTKAEEFNDMLKEFNKPKIAYNFVMSREQAEEKITEMYPGELEISPNKLIKPSIPNSQLMNDTVDNLQTYL